MKVVIKRLDSSLPLPAYQTSGAAGFDFYARETVTISAGSVTKIPTGLIVATPPGYMLLIAARSSLASKKSLMLSNGVGIVDSDYAGPEDEILISVYNISDRVVMVEKGERIAQGIFIKVEQAEWKEVDAVEQKSRGGFGSTG